MTGPVKKSGSQYDDYDDVKLEYMDLEEFLIENELPISSMFEEQNSGSNGGGGGSGGGGNNSGSSGGGGTGGSNDTSQQNGCVEDDSRGQRHPSHPSQTSQSQQVIVVPLNHRFHPFSLIELFNRLWRCPDYLSCLSWKTRCNSRLVKLFQVIAKLPVNQCKWNYVCWFQ